MNYLILTVLKYLVLIFLVFISLFFALIYLLSLPGNKKLIIDEKAVEEKKKMRKKLFKTYIKILFIGIAILAILYYLLLRGGSIA